jgi:hypothetical protein
MYKSHPKTTIVFALLALSTAFALPAFLPPLPIAQTAVGLHLALLVFAMWMQRIMSAEKTAQTWPSAISFPLTIVAAATALGAAPNDSAADIALRAGGIAALVGLGWAGGIALSNSRPRGWGKTTRRDLVIAALGFTALIAWNHLYQFPDQHGTALLFDLVGMALFWTFPALGKSARQGLAPRAAWAHRVLEACATCIIVSYFVTAYWFVAGQSDTVVAGVMVAAIFAATLVLGLIEDRAQHPFA